MNTTVTLTPATEKAPRVFVPEAAIANMVANLRDIEIRPSFVPGTRQTVVQVVRGQTVLMEAPNNSLLIQAMAEKLWGKA